MLKRLINNNFSKLNGFAVLSLIISLALLVFNVRHSLYIYTLIIGLISGYYILKDTGFLSVVSIFLLSFFWGVGLLVLVAATASFLNILIQPWLMIIPPLVLLYFLLQIPIVSSKVRIKITPAEIMLIFTTSLALISRVLPVKGFLAPILHDPISHATWANDIVRTGMINTFYSPGLHIISAFGNMVDGISTATYILRLTNLFNALFIVPVFYYLEAWLKNKWISVIGIFIFFVSLFPARYFWTAGKNALVMNLPYFFLLLFIYMALGNLKRRRDLILNLLIFVTIINHYPSAAISLLALLGHVLSDRLRKNISTFFVGSGFGLLWGLSKFRFLLTSISTSVQDVTNVPKLTIQNFLNFLTEFVKQTKPQFNSQGSQILLPIGLLLIAIIGLFSMRKRDYLPFIIYVTLFTLFGTVIFFNQIARSYLYIVYETQTITFFLIINTAISIATGSLLSILTKKNYKDIYFFMVIGLLIVISIFNSKQVYSEYIENQSTLNMISWNDVEMFEWIDENVDQDQIILNNASKNDVSYIVFTSDGASWIPAFTDNEIAMPFDEFASEKTYDIYQIYKRLSNQTYTCQDIDYLLSKNVDYYYKDSVGIFGSQFKPSNLNSNFILVKDIGGVRIYKINPCQVIPN